jgi:YegS/Rv2252/BmrU family lipid kinase
VTRPIALLVNPSSRGGGTLKQLPAVEAELRRRGLAHTVHLTQSLEHGGRLARAAADLGELVVPMSGDGLLGAVAGALARREDAVMGILPGGRGNDFARVCGIPRDPVAACSVLAGGVVRSLDVGEIDGRIFVGVASLGFDSDANRIANSAPARLGNLVYAYAALRALVGWHHARFEVVVGDERRSFLGWSAVAANSKAYGGGMFIAPDADLADGQLDVVLTSATSRLRFLRSLPLVFKGGHVDLPSVEVLRGPEVRISADRPFTVYADGDPIAELPVTVRAVPGAIRVLLPA